MPSKAMLRSRGRMLSGVPFRMSYLPISSKRPLLPRHLTVACGSSVVTVLTHQVYTSDSALLPLSH
jgi:hypothetical protein